MGGGGGGGGGGGATAPLSEAATLEVAAPQQVRGVLQHPELHMPLCYLSVM